jgi:hypothetical protein
MRRVYIEYMGDSIEIPPGETVVGRGVGCALRFNDPAVSRRHLRFIRRDHNVFVEDLGSNNGTLLNGEPVRGPTALRPGDVVKVGSRELTMSIVADEGKEPSTLKDMPIEEISDGGRARTTPIVRIPELGTPHPTQKCPRCGERVTEEDDECATCHFKWGTFRPMAPTDVGANPMNRRKADRHEVELHLVYVSEELEIEALTRDLSSTGVYICSEMLDAVGTACELTILLDGGPPVRARGVVRRVVERYEEGKDPVGFAVEFTNIAPDDRAWLAAVAARASK